MNILFLDFFKIAQQERKLWRMDKAKLIENCEEKLYRKIVNKNGSTKMVYKKQYSS